MTVVGSIYRHWKGANHLVLFTARQSTNGPDEGERVVVYISLASGQICARDEEDLHRKEAEVTSHMTEELEAALDELAHQFGREPLYTRAADEVVDAWRRVGRYVPPASLPAAMELLASSRSDIVFRGAERWEAQVIDLALDRYRRIPFGVLASLAAASPGGMDLEIEPTDVPTHDPQGGEVRAVAVTQARIVLWLARADAAPAGAPGAAPVAPRVPGAF